MDIIWDDRKNEKLLKDRGVSFELVAEMIMQKRYVAILKNPARKAQRVFLLRIEGYIHVVPFVVDKKGNIVLKTVFRSRKFQKLYEGRESQKS